jgi:biotin synthase
MTLRTDDIRDWLSETRTDRLEQLWTMADRTRREHVGDDVHLRGLIELGNHCIRRCGYCGINATHTALPRYRMTREEILACARQAVTYGYGTVVLQAGEDPAITGDWMAELIRAIKQQTPLAVTLSLGERSEADLAAWRQAGADRYLLRFETSNRSLYERIHPPRANQPRSDRIALLEQLRQIGYEIGSGVLIGLPGQSWDDLANDIALFAELDLDMIGVGPYIPHPAGEVATLPPLPAVRQVPADELTTCKVLALARLVCPDANLPATTALATINVRTGREHGLQRGANVVMPNLTPPRYRVMYEIYPAKASTHESAEQTHRTIVTHLAALGRPPGLGRGDSPRYRQHTHITKERSSCPSV